MNAKQLKNLAEAHIFAGRELTDEEYNLLKESKYASVVKRKTEFDKLLENAFPGEVSHELPKTYQKRKYSGFGFGVNKNDVDHLIDMIGIEYVLDPEICPPACPDVYIFRYFSIHCCYYIISVIM